MTLLLCPSAEEDANAPDPFLEVEEAPASSESAFPQRTFRTKEKGHGRGWGRGSHISGHRLRPKPDRSHIQHLEVVRGARWIRGAGQEETQGPQQPGRAGGKDSLRPAERPEREVEEIYF